VASRLEDRRNTKLRIVQFLDGLGGTSTSVASALAHSGVRGHRYALNDCPVARFTNAVLAADPRCGRVKVGLRHLRVRRARGLRLTVPMPPAVRSFIMEFDDGDFPELETAPHDKAAISLEDLRSRFHSESEIIS
jgi:hypothetical protein